MCQVSYSLCSNCAEVVLPHCDRLWCLILPGCQGLGAGGILAADDVLSNCCASSPHWPSHSHIAFLSITIDNIVDYDAHAVDIYIAAQANSKLPPLLLWNSFNKDGGGRL